MANPKDSSTDWWKRHPEAYGTIAAVLGLILICCLYVLWRGPNRRLWWWKKNNPDMPEGVEGGNKKLHPSQETFYSEPGTIRTVSDKPMATTTPTQQQFSRDGSAVLPIRKSSLFTIKQARKLAAAVNQNTPPVPTYRPTSTGPVSPNPRHTREFRDSTLPPGALPPGAAAPPPTASRPPSQGNRISGVPSRRSVTSPVSAYSAPDSDFGGTPGASAYQTYPPPLPSPPLAYAPFMTKTPPPGAISPSMAGSPNMSPGSVYPRSSPPVSPHLSARPPSQQRVVSPSGSAHSNNLLRPGATSPQSTISGNSQRLSAQQLPYSHAQTLNALAGNTLSVHPPNGSASRHANRLSSRSAKSATSITPSPLAQSMTGKDLGTDDDVYATEFGAAVDSRRYQHRSMTYVPHPESPRAPPFLESPTRPLMRGFPTGGEAI